MILGLYGAGGFGKETYDMVSLYLREDWENIIYIDDTMIEGQFRGTRVMPYENFLKEFGPECAQIAITQGEPQNKRLLYDRIKLDGYSLPTLVHPRAYVASDAVLGEGTIIFVGSTISSTVRIGNCSSVLTYTLIGHDATIGDFCQISAMTLINGKVRIGNESFIGGGVSIRDHISIGNSCVIAMGACVMKDVSDGMLVMGNPARVIQKNDRKGIFR